VVVYVPPQTIEAGRVRIVVVEGKLAAVQVRGNRQFTDDNIRRSLPALAPGATPNLRVVDAQIQLANENPAKQVQVLLAPAAQPGRSQAQVSVAEEPVQRWKAMLDNTGNGQTGRLRAGLAWQHANLSGRDDVASLAWQTAPANLRHVNAVSAGYHLPLYADLGALDVFAGYSDVSGIHTATAAGNLQFTGRGAAAGLRLTRHLMRQGAVDSRISVGLDDRAYLNQCAIAGLPDGACGSAGESVSVQPVSLEYEARAGGRWPWSAAIGMQANLALGGGLDDAARFAAVRPGATPDYIVAHARGEVLAPLPAGWRLHGRAAGQWTADALVPGEQFGIGGAQSVRGFEERELAGDRGSMASLELWAPSWEPGFAPGARLTAFAFGDAGWIDNVMNAPCLGNRTSCRIAGAGLGARLASGALQGELDAAESLTAGATTRKHAARIHFSLGYSF
jgi:hemolysin activation/secretion protein